MLFFFFLGFHHLVLWFHVVQQHCLSFVLFWRFHQSRMSTLRTIWMFFSCISMCLWCRHYHHLLAQHDHFNVCGSIITNEGKNISLKNICRCVLQLNYSCTLCWLIILSHILSILSWSSLCCQKTFWPVKPWTKNKVSQSVLSHDVSNRSFGPCGLWGGFIWSFSLLPRDATDQIPSNWHLGSFKAWWIRLVMNTQIWVLNHF